MTIEERIRSYLGNGGLVNPEMMEHDKVRDLIMDCQDTIEALKKQNAHDRKQWRHELREQRKLRRALEECRSVLDCCLDCGKPLAKGARFNCNECYD